MASEFENFDVFMVHFRLEPEEFFKNLNAAIGLIEVYGVKIGFGLMKLVKNYDPNIF